MTILGVLRIKYKRGQLLTRELEKNTLPKYTAAMHTKVFKTFIRESVRCKEAITGRVRLSTYAPLSTVESDYSDLCDEILREVGK